MTELGHRIAPVVCLIGLVGFVVLVALGVVT